MKQTQDIWRHEDKYLMHEVELRALQARLRGLLQPDEHTPEKGFYHISSLYFDDWENTMLRQNMEGLNQRIKFRIRRYEDGSLFSKRRAGRTG